MEEEIIGAEQARLLGSALECAGIARRQLWWHYFRIGGDVGEYECDAYLYQALHRPRLQRDLLAQAANELVGNLPSQMPLPEAPFASDLIAPPDSDRT